MDALETALTLDVDELTVGDLDTIEELTGVGFEEALQQLTAMKPKAIIAFVYVLGRQRDPGFSLEDARRTKLKALSGAETPKAEEPPDPQTAAGA